MFQNTTLVHVERNSAAFQIEQHFSMKKYS